MTKTFTLLLFLLSVQLCTAQKIRFTDTTNRWSVYNFGLSPSDPGFYQHWECYYLGDSVVNGTGYQVTQFGLVREDTIAGKVYIRFNPPNLLPYDTIERVLYDYNWQVGDTVIHSYPSNNFKHYVAAIDSTQVNGIWHKVWHFRTANFQLGEYNVIEGIGSAKGPWFPVYPYEFENVYYLSCFHNNNSKPTLLPAVEIEDNSYDFDNLKSCTVGVGDLENTDDGAFIAPNPVTENSIVQLPGSIANGKLIVVNAFGQQVAEQNISHLSVVPLQLRAAAPGIYTCVIFNNATGERYHLKFILQ